MQVKLYTAVTTFRTVDPDIRHPNSRFPKVRSHAFKPE